MGLFFGYEGAGPAGEGSFGDGAGVVHGEHDHPGRDGHLLQGVQDPESVEAIHVDVEDDDVWFMLGDGAQGLGAVLRFGNDYYFPAPFQEHAHDAAHGVVVVDDEGAYHVGSVGLYAFARRKWLLVHGVYYSAWAFR